MVIFDFGHSTSADLATPSSIPCHVLTCLLSSQTSKLGTEPGSGSGAVSSAKMYPCSKRYAAIRKVRCPVSENIINTTDKYLCSVIYMFLLANRRCVNQARIGQDRCRAWQKRTHIQHPLSNLRRPSIQSSSYLCYRQGKDEYYTLG